MSRWVVPLPAAGCLIFDLDNTLLRTDQIPPAAIRPVVDAIAGARRTTPPERWRAELFSALYESSYDAVVRRLELSDSERDAGFAAYTALRLPPSLHLALYPDASAAVAQLQVLRKNGVRGILWTHGFPQFQSDKIDRLGLRDQFDVVIIEPVRLGGDSAPYEYLDGALARANCRDNHFIVVDDDPRKLRAGADRGGITVLIDRSGTQAATGADFVVADLRLVTQSLLTSVLGARTERE